MNKNLNIFIIDDHPMMRAGLRELLKNQAEMVLVGESSTGEEGLEKLSKNAEDLIVLLDISLPDCKGTELAKKIKLMNSRIQIVFLSMHQEPEFVLQAFRGGAEGYVLKSSESVEILNAIRTVALGKKYVSPELSSILIEEKSKLAVELTSRELEVLSWVVKGLSAKEVAEKMKISHRTVEVHKQNIMKKFDAKNLADVVRIAFELGFK